MLAVSHQPTMYVANTQPYYYVQAQSTVPAGQWTTQLVPVSNSGSTYVYSSYPSRQSIATTSYPVQQQQQITRPVTYTINAQQVKPAVVGYAQQQQQPPTFQRNSSPSHQTFQPGPPDFTPASPVMSEATTASDDSSGSFASSSSRYNLPSSAINHYTAPAANRTRQRRASFVQQPRLLDPYGVPIAGQSSLSLPHASQQMYSQPSQQLSHPSLHQSSSPNSQPVFVRNTGRSGNPVSFHQSQNQQVYSSFDLYKPAPQRTQSAPQPTTLMRRASTTSLVPAGPILTSGSYGAGLGMGGPGMGMGFGGDGHESRDKKWWRIGR